MGLYKENKNAKVGTLIECPICHKRFKKFNIHKHFAVDTAKINFTIGMMVIGINTICLMMSMIG